VGLAGVGANHAVPSFLLIKVRSCVEYVAIRYSKTLSAISESRGVFYGHEYNVCKVVGAIMLVGDRSRSSKIHEQTVWIYDHSS